MSEISARRFLAKTLESFLKPHVLRSLERHQRPSREIKGTSVHMQISAATIKMGIVAVRSFEESTGVRWPVYFHEDGSLDRKDIDFLHVHLPDSVVVARADADRRVNPDLEHHPALVHMRQDFVFGIKFFDPHFYAPADNYILLDSDILFFRPASHIRAWAEGHAETCHYNKDPMEVYAVPRKDIEATFAFPLLPGVNGGLLLLRKEALDWELSARFLHALSSKVTKLHFLEQTLYALNLSNYGRGGALPREYRIYWGGPFPKQSICVHYAGDLKWQRFFTAAFREFCLPSARHAR